MQGGSKAGIVRAVVCALVGVVALLAFADGATAKFRTGLSSDEFLSTSDATRTHWFDQAVDARAKVVRIDVKWSAIEVQIARDPTNPADRAYRWGRSTPRSAMRPPEA